MSLTQLRGVGPKTAERLAKLDIHSVEDLLFHLPFRYEDRTHIKAIGGLRAGEESLIEATVQLTEIKFGKQRMLLSRLSDGTGFITLRFFHFNARQKELLSQGTLLRCYGEVRLGPGGLEMVHPEYQVIGEQAAQKVEDALTPVYPATDGLHQLSLRNLTQQSLELLRKGKLQLRELLPQPILSRLQLPLLKDALIYVHRPPTNTAMEELLSAKHPMLKRLVIEDLLAHYLSLRQLRAKMRKHNAFALTVDNGLIKQFIHNLPFNLTRAQQSVCEEIKTDLQRPHPMQRLVQGDVGSGKTVVAVLAALAAVEAGYQAVVMAPTEILAEQHYRNFSQWLEPLCVPVTWLTGKLKTSERNKALAMMANGETQVAVGTHALFQEEVSFFNLALVIVDEQHRFGVHQRLALREKGRQGDIYPHQLIMTATPIPRTLSMAVYADLDCSVIDELPPGRQPTETVVMPDSRRKDIVQRVHNACRQGKQVYWVCTLIEDSEALQCQAAEDTATVLAEALPEVRIGLVHGRMKADEKEQVMRAFKAEHIDLLVATTVIEVGVDVPNASLMIIENAERLGLAQLHQLRGRVGRGAEASVCVLMYHGRLSENARARLGVMRETNDGFIVARKDLELRGPGEVLGTRQTGVLQLKVADIQRDQILLADVSVIADEILASHPECVAPLIQRWVGHSARYGSV